jgi:hypothetical protein
VIRPMRVLYCDRERPVVPGGLKAAARRELRGHDNLQLAREHGGWWATCLSCGRLYGVGGPEDDELTLIEHGDESCNTR